MQRKHLSWIVILTLAAASLLTACGGVSSPTATPAGSEPTPAPTTPAPSASQVLLIAPEGSAADVMAQLSELAAQNSWSAAQKSELLPADLEGVKVVVFLATPANLNDLLDAGSTTQFVVVTNGSLDSKPNLTTITTDANAQTFAAGYIASIIAPDWRSGALLPDTPAGLDDIFTRGVQYYCGRCAPYYAPVINFPVTAARSASASSSDWKAAFDKLDENVLETLYVSPAAVSQDLIETLVEKEIILVSAGALPDSASKVWAAAVQPDVPAALKSIWADLAAGQGGKTAAAPVAVTNINDALLSEGRLRLVQQVVDDLNSGALRPGD